MPKFIVFTTGRWVSRLSLYWCLSKVRFRICHHRILPQTNDRSTYGHNGAQLIYKDNRGNKSRYTWKLAGARMWYINRRRVEVHPSLSSPLTHLPQLYVLLRAFDRSSWTHSLSSSITSRLPPWRLSVVTSLLRRPARRLEGREIMPIASLREGRTYLWTIWAVSFLPVFFVYIELHQHENIHARSRRTSLYLHTFEPLQLLHVTRMTVLIW